MSSLNTPYKLDALSRTNEWAYGAGHFINDLSAALGFNFLLIYLKIINPVDDDNPSYYAGLILLVGQIVDGFATISIGYLSDKTKTRFGQRKPWYVFGYITLAFTQLFMYQDCYICSDDSGHLKVVYYSVVFALMNIGWAALQNAHMSMVAGLSGCQKKKNQLNNLRCSFTYLASFFVLGLGIILFNTIKDQKFQFSLLSYAVIFLGSITSLFFIFNINEPFLVKEQRKLTSKRNSELTQLRQKKQGINNSTLHDKLIENENEIDVKIPISFWFKQIDFYIYGFVFMFVRLVNNTYYTFIQFYLISVLDYEASEITPISLAIVPLISNISQILVSCQTDYLFEKVGRKTLNLISLILILICGIFYWILTPEYKNYVYIIAFFSGISLSTCLNTGIAYISDVVGENDKAGAIVYGAYGLFDRFATGIIIFLIMKSQSFEKNDPTYIKTVLVSVPIISNLLAFILMLIGKKGNNTYEKIREDYIAYTETKTLNSRENSLGSPNKTQRQSQQIITDLLQSKNAI